MDAKSKKGGLLGTGKLAKLLKEHKSTIEYYSNEGILPFQQGLDPKEKNNRKLRRYYDPESSKERIKEIRKLQKKMTIPEIKERFKHDTGGV